MGANTANEIERLEREIDAAKTMLERQQVEERELLSIAQEAKRDYNLQSNIVGETMRRILFLKRQLNEHKREALGCIVTTSDGVL